MPEGTALIQVYRRGRSRPYRVTFDLATGKGRRFDLNRYPQDYYASRACITWAERMVGAGLIDVRCPSVSMASEWPEWAYVAPLERRFRDAMKAAWWNRYARINAPIHAIWRALDVRERRIKARAVAA